MLVHFDDFRDIIFEIADIKEELKKQNRRVHPPICTYTAYQMLKQIAEPLRRVFKSRRYNQQTCLDKFAYALRKLHLLICQLVEYDRDELAATLRNLYHRLFALLPEQTIIQHELFDAEKYQTPHKKPRSTKGFINWLQDYHLLGFVRRDVERRRAFKPLKIVQPSLRLR